MAYTATRQDIAHHVFQRHYAKLGQSLKLHLPLVASELYSSSLISPGTKDKVLSDAPTPSHDRALTLLNDLEGRLKSRFEVFEKFLDILCDHNVGLSHLAEPMRLDYQQLCDRTSHLGSKPTLPLESPKIESSTEQHKIESNSTGAVVEQSSLVAPGISSGDVIDLSRRVDNSYLYHDETPKEARPKDLQFFKSSELVEDRQVTQEVTSSKAYSCVDQGLKHTTLPQALQRKLQRKIAPSVIDTPNQDPQELELLGEAMGAVQRFFASVQESRDRKIEKTREECEEKMSAVREYYEVECDRLKSEMEQADKAHEVEVSHLKQKYDRDTESLLNTVQLFASRSAIQEGKMAEIEKELTEIRNKYTLKSQEVDQLRLALAEREAELNDIKKLMDAKEDEFKVLKGCIKPSLKLIPVLHVRKLELQTKVSVLEEIQELVSQCCKCHPEDLEKLKRELTRKIERLTASRKRRSLSL